MREYYNKLIAEFREKNGGKAPTENEKGLLELIARVEWRRKN